MLTLKEQMDVARETYSWMTPHQLTVYESGPIANCTDDEAMGWREYVKSKAPEIKWLDPMVRDCRHVQHLSQEQTNWIVTGDKADIDASDALLVYAPFPSCGTSMEVMYAYGRKPIITVVPPGAFLSPWLDYHSTSIYDDLNIAISWFKNWAECYG